MMSSELSMRARRLEAFAQQDPHNLTLLRDLAETYHAAGEHERALEVVDRAIGIDGDGTQAWDALRGQLLLALGRWAAAAQLFEDALAKDPTSAALAFNLAYARWAEGRRPEAAVALLRRAAELNPSDPNVSHYLAVALEESGQPDQAQHVLDRVLQLDPRHEKALIAGARLSLEQGDLDKASWLARRAIEAHPRSAAAREAAGLCAMAALDGAQAMKHFRQAADLAPQNADIQYGLAQAALMQGRPSHARKVLETLIAGHPAHSQAWTFLAWIHLTEGNHDAAFSACEKAVAADPDDADALAALAAVHAAKGDRAATSATAHEALKKQADNELAASLTRWARSGNDSALDLTTLFGTAARGPFAYMQGGAELNHRLERSNLLRRLERRRRTAQPKSTPSAST